MEQKQVLSLTPASHKMDKNLKNHCYSASIGMIMIMEQAKYFTMFKVLSWPLLLQINIMQLRMISISTLIHGSSQ
jgi:hypothetical protein